MILGIDQGTTGTTAALIDEKAQLIGSFTASVPIKFPSPGWVEQDPKLIIESLEKAIGGLLSKTGFSPHKIQAIGLTNQRETVSLFEGDKALHPFIVWQDRRTSKICEKLKKYKKEVQRRTSTPLDPYFSSTKIQWIQKNERISKSNRNIRFRTIESFLLKSLCGEDVSEMSNAHRTQLLNIKKLQWDPDLFDIFDIPLHWAPNLIPSEGMNLRTRGFKALPDGIPIQAVLGDQQAALFGQLGWKKGTGKITFGTGSFILINTGEKPVFSRNAMVGTIALQWANGKSLYALEGSAFVCGAWIQWLREQMGIISHSSESETLAREVSGSEGVLVIPALTGMGAPFWKPDLKGAILGLSRGTNRSHIARASLEALCFQNRALIESMKKDLPFSKGIQWKVDGGAVENSLLMQIQADVLQERIDRPLNTEATAIGAGLLAAKAQGLLSLEEIENSWKLRDRFQPNKQNKKIYESIYKSWISSIKSLSS